MPDLGNFRPIMTQFGLTTRAVSSTVEVHKMKTTDVSAATRANKAAWEASAPLHGSGEEWSALLSAAARPGFSVLDPCLTDTLNGIGLADRRAVQIGCNNARELLSLAAFGADPALGIDQSPAFLAMGEQLAKAAGLHTRLLQADIYALPDGVGRFDLVLVTTGVLNWMPDLPRLFDIIASLMAPGAVLLIYETHPLLEVFDPDAERPHEPAFSYFEQEAQEVVGVITYDGTDGGPGETGYWFIYPLEDIVMAGPLKGVAASSAAEPPDRDAQPARLVGEIFSDSGAGENDNALWHRCQELVIPLERRGLGVARPVGLKDNLRHIALFGPAGGDALGPLRTAAMQQHHVRMLCAGAVQRVPDRAVIVALEAAGKGDARTLREHHLRFGPLLRGQEVAAIDNRCCQGIMVDL